MGTPGNGTIYITWTENRENRIEAEKLTRQIEELFELQGKMSEEVAKEKFGDGFYGDFAITNVDTFDGELQVELESSKIKNLEWQMDRVKELFDRYSFSGFSFSADVKTIESYIFDTDG